MLTPLLEGLRDSAVVNLGGAVTLVVDDSPFSLELTTQALMGFGMPVRYVCHSAPEAMEILKDHTVDLLFVDVEMPGMDGLELVSWLRRSGLDPNAFAPVIMTGGHVRKDKLNRVRDCGANFLLTKPFSATTLLERIVWTARDTRPFLEVGDYFGPDRRFRSGSGPGGVERRADLIRKAELEAARAAEKAAAGDEA
ncbi:MAG TPA: response regulator [Brevundimonas sp.]|uniref:response regulator n=1 Tax=Brevundimonas sp. TaxID=1871086 RepID=UPI002638A380|nr:response regulator [Brevundimonas sp.]HRO33308.1 response regulator [Brevundimonas sp.]